MSEHSTSSSNDESEPKTKKIKFWTPEQDQRLRECIEQYGEKNWKMISFEISGKSPLQCLQRWNKILRPGITKGPWTDAEDDTLRYWVANFGAKGWTKCSKTVGTRSGKQCRERWVNVLDPKNKKGQWTVEEDKLIFDAHRIHGPKWQLIAELLEGRTENSVKNRFNSNIRKMLNVKVKQQELANAVTVGREPSDIVGRHEIPMSFDDYVKRKTLSGLSKLESSIAKAEEFLQSFKLGNKPKIEAQYEAYPTETPEVVANDML